MLIIFTDSSWPILRATLILLFWCNPIPYSEFLDSAFFGEKIMSYKPLIQYVWNLVEVFIYESSNFYKNFNSFELHMISQINFLPKLLESETVVLKLTEFNSKLTFF